MPASSTPTSPGVRIKVDSLSSGGMKGGKRNTLLVNDGRGDLGGSVRAVWGSKAMDGVGDVDLVLDVKVNKMARRYQGEEAIGGEGGEGGGGGRGGESQTVRVKGLLSSAAWGQGRSSPDRQYFYINGRPADLRSVQKVVNEVYKSFNTHQVPLAILDFAIPKGAQSPSLSQHASVSTCLSVWPGKFWRC